MRCDIHCIICGAWLGSFDDGQHQKFDLKDGTMHFGEHFYCWNCGKNLPGEGKE